MKHSKKEISKIICYIDFFTIILNSKKQDNLYKIFIRLHSTYNTYHLQYFRDYSK